MVREAGRGAIGKGTFITCSCITLSRMKVRGMCVWGAGGGERVMPLMRHAPVLYSLRVTQGL